MVRSLLDSSLLQRSSGLRFALLFLGVCVLFASAAVWFGTADFDYHFSFDKQVNDVSFQQETQTTPYRQLSSDSKHTIDAALNGKTFDFEDDTKDLPAFVSRGGTYYKFDSRRVVDWTAPGSFGPIITAIVGVWITIESIQHERAHLGPRGV